MAREETAGRRSAERNALRQRIERFGAEVDAYFAGCDSDIDRPRKYIWCVLRPALGGLDLEEKTGLGGRRIASDLLRAAQEEFEHIRGRLDAAGGPKNIRSLPVR